MIKQQQQNRSKSKTTTMTIGIEENTDSFLGDYDTGYTFRGENRQDEVAPEPTMIPIGTRRHADFEMAWHEYVKGACTGDIVIFDGEGSPVSWLIEKGEGFKKYSHVGIILCVGLMKLLFESTGETENPDMTSGEIDSGPRLVPAMETIRDYINNGSGSTVVIRRLWINKPAFKAQKGFLPSDKLPDLLIFVNRIVSLPYEKNMLEFMRASSVTRAIKLIYDKETLDSYFCSELVYAALECLGLVNRDNAALYIPPDFSEYTQAIKFPYLKGTGGRTGKPIEPIVGLGPNIKLYFPNTKGPRAVKYPGGVHHGSRITAPMQVPKSVRQHAQEYLRTHNVPRSKSTTTVAAANRLMINTYV